MQGNLIREIVCANGTSHNGEYRINLCRCANNNIYMFDRLKEFFRRGFKTSSPKTASNHDVNLQRSPTIRIFSVIDGDVIVRNVIAHSSKKSWECDGYHHEGFLKSKDSPCSGVPPGWTIDNLNYVKRVSFRNYSDTVVAAKKIMLLSTLSEYYPTMTIKKYTIELRTVGIVTEADMEFAKLANQVFCR